MQRLGERMIGMDDAILDELPLDERLRDALRDAASIRGRGALRRQKQLIGKLMRSSDADTIREALQTLDADDRRARRTFADAELWRDRIVRSDDTAVLEFITATGTDGDELIELVTELRSCRDDKQMKTLGRSLFRVIHAALVKREQDDRIPR